MASRRLILQSAAASLAAGTFPCVLADAPFPNRPIRFIVPLAPGTGTDTSARHVARHLQEIAGQPVVVDNRPGANGFIAAQGLLSAPADGYTVLIGNSSLLAVNTALFKKMPYDPVEDFTPLSMVLRAPLVLLVPGDSPYKDVPSLLAAARANPGKLNYGSGSTGYQLMTELFCEEAKINVAHVPFKSSVAALSAVMAGTVQMAFIDITGVLEVVKGGHVRALAIATEKRSPIAPGIPTATEVGVPGYTASFWSAAVVSSKTPKPEADRLSRMIQQVVALPDTFETFGRMGAEQMIGGPADVRSRQLGEIQQWKRVASSINLEPQ
jgi:tripartite-type tricarboxylate transporter receptor subunit TctC